jgi:hypothetical protein
MEENILPVQPDFKIYRNRTIEVGTFLGGPLVAGYMAAENFRKLEQASKVKTTWIMAVSATVLIFAAIILVPNMDKVPSYIIPIFYTLITRYLIQKYQGDEIKKHVDAGGPTFSSWRAVWMGLVGAVVLVVALIAFMLLAKPELLQ